MFVAQCFEIAVTSLSRVRGLFDHRTLKMRPLHGLKMLGNRYPVMKLSIQKNGVLNYTVSKPENSAVLVILFYFDCLCSCMAGGTYGEHCTLIG